MFAENSIVLICALSLAINGGAIGLLFLRTGFRPSQYFSVIALFSFAVRPLATSTCEYFIPFYYYEPGLYAQGVLLGNGALALYNVGLVIVARRQFNVPALALSELGLLADFTLIIALVLDLVTLSLFGTAILPGVRTTGLQQAAAGSQVFFALVSGLTVIGFGLAVACALVQQPGSRTLWSAFRIVGFFAISMLFYQRGALLLGGVFGLLLTSIFDPRFYTRRLGRTMLILATLLIFAMFARPVITAVVARFEPSAQIAEPTGPLVSQTAGCRIANTANQEHDQVWPTLFVYVERYGPDSFRNVLAAFVRPFLDADTRDRLGYKTSVDTLNLYNDSRTYLEYNFGFSISSFQYYYYSAGYFMLILVLLAGVAASFLENRVGKDASIIDSSFLWRPVLILNVVYVLASPLDEQLKWAGINFVTAVVLIGAFRLLRHLGRGSSLDPAQWPAKRLS